MSAAFSILLVLGLLGLVSGVQAKYLLLEGEHWEKEVREKRMLDIARSELKLQMYVIYRSRSVFM
jgi:hypothetical protein